MEANVNKRADSGRHARIGGQAVLLNMTNCTTRSTRRTVGEFRTDSTCRTDCGQHTYSYPISAMQRSPNQDNDPKNPSRHRRKAKIYRSRYFHFEVTAVEAETVVRESKPHEMRFYLERDSTSPSIDESISPASSQYSQSPVSPLKAQIPKGYSSRRRAPCLKVAPLTIENLAVHNALQFYRDNRDLLPPTMPKPTLPLTRANLEAHNAPLQQVAIPRLKRFVYTAKGPNRW